MALDWPIYIKGASSLMTLYPHIRNLARSVLYGPLEPQYEEMIRSMIRDTQTRIEKANEEVSRILIACEEMDIQIDEPGRMARQAPKHLSRIQRLQFRFIVRRLRNLCRGFNRSVNDLVFRISCYRGMEVGLEPVPKIFPQPNWLRELESGHDNLKGIMLNVEDFSVQEIIGTIKEYLRLCNVALSRIR